MPHPYFDIVQLWAIRIFAGLGGIAGVSKIIEWMTRGPKILGEVEFRIFADEHRPDGTLVGANLLIQVYLVNARVRPVTVRGFKATIKAPGGKEWLKGEMHSIPDKFHIPLAAEIDFASARLYDKVGTDVLEYGKGVRGWLRVIFPGIENASLCESQIKIEITDAFNHIHVVNSKFVPGGEKIGYFPGAGIKQ